MSFFRRDYLNFLSAVMDSTYLLIFLAILVLLLCRKFFLVGRSLPPGPTGYPILGNLPSLMTDPPRKIAEWSKIYGDIVGVYLGGRFMVVLHDPELARTVLADENTTGRDQKFFLADFFRRKGLLMSEGELWKEQRRFALSSLRNLGMGKSWLEDAILAEATGAIKAFQEQSSVAFNPRNYLTLSVSNVICALVFGKRYEHSDKKFQRLCTLIGENGRLSGDLFPLLSFPWLKTLPFGPFQQKWQLFSQNIMDVVEFCKGLVAERKRAIEDPNHSQDEENEDFVKGYFIEQAKQQSHNGATSFTDEQMLYSVINLFAAGTETTTSSLLWGFTFMVRYPDVQRKVQAEIDEHIARDTPVRISDKGLLKYTEATIFDIQRLATVVPLSIAHTNLEATTIGGFKIPKRTLINTNAYAIHRDGRFWARPYVLYPEHFLDGSGNVVVPKAFLPFGVGKRACVGEALAKMELYLFFTNILQKFRLEGDVKTLPKPDGEPAGLIRSPSLYNIRFIPRD